MKKEYETVIISVCLFENEDIVTESVGGGLTSYSRESGTAGYELGFEQLFNK